MTARTKLKPKHQRLVLALIAIVAIIAAGLLAASALRDEAAYFVTPSDIAAKPPEAGVPIRLGGMVEKGSIVRSPDGLGLAFVVTDGKAKARVAFRGIVPDLFREGSGMVADGSLNGDGVFMATRILAKHDERYMPPQLGEMPIDRDNMVGTTVEPAR
jgi:cytochrome c-type biogenesis protein CcmE